MAGKLYNGSDDYDFVRSSKAFCEGYKARTLSASPTNPHPAGSPDAVAFAAGMAAKVGEASTDADKACCAPTGLDAAV